MKRLGSFFVAVLLVATGFTVGLNTGSFTSAGSGPAGNGDVDGSGSFDLADPVYLLNFLFSAGEMPGCMKAADSNGDGVVNLSDPVQFFGFLFAGGAQPPAPYPGCGIDPTDDNLTCDSFDACP